MTVQYPTIADCVGNTPLVRLQRLPGETSNTLLVKLEGNNPAGSVKDRPALSMITRAELRGDIRPGDTLIEATSGNTGIALAMAAAIKGYKMILIMPDNSTAERKAAMTAYGAELILVSKEEGMEGARDLADKLQREGRGKVLDQFANGDNPEAHYHSTGPEIWQQTGGSITHFVSSMGTTGTIMGVSRYLKEQNPAVQIVGCNPWRARPSRESDAGRRNTCRRSMTPVASTGSSTCTRTKPRTSCAGWPARKASSAACPPAGRWRRCCACPANWRMPCWWRSSATAATATCLPASMTRAEHVHGQK